MKNNMMKNPENIQFDEKLSFRYGYTCFDCPYHDTRDGKLWCSAWNREISDPNYEGDRCSKRPAHPNKR